MAPPKPITTNDPATVAGPDEQSRAQSHLSNSAIFGYSLPTQRTDYLPLFGMIYALQDYVAGKGSYDQLKSKIKAWAQAENYGDPINQAARANILKILEGISDSDLKSRADSALMLMKAHSAEVSGKDPAPKKDKKRVLDPDEDVVVPVKKDPKPISPPPTNAGKPYVVSTDLKKWKEAKQERNDKLSDAALGWSAEDSKKYPRVAYAIMTVRDFVAVRELQPDFVRAALLVWRRHPDFEKDPVLKQTYQNLMKALSPSSLKAEYNIQPAAVMLSLMEEVDASVSGLPKPSAPPVKAKEEKKPKDEAKTPVTPTPPPTPPAAPEAATDAKTLLSDAAIFGDLLSTWNEPSVKSGSCLALSSALYVLRDFFEGKADYKKLKEKLANWEGSACYQEAVSYRARSNLLTILGGVGEGSPLSKKAQSALMALKTTKNIDPPKVVTPPPTKTPEAPKPTPAVPVKYAELDVAVTSKAPSAGKATVESFKTQRREIAEREHIKAMKKAGKSFNFSGEVWVQVDLNGEISKVTFKNVTVVRPGETGENVTSAEATELMKNIANAYRAEVKFAKVEKKSMGFKLELVAVAPGETPSTPIPPPAPKDPVTPPPPTSADEKKTYTYTFTSGHPTKLDRDDSLDNFREAMKRSMRASKAVFERYAKQDPSLSLSAKAFIKVDPATGYVTEVKFEEVKPGGGMSSTILEDILKAFADGVHGNTRWKETKDGNIFAVPMIWAAKS